MGPVFAAAVMWPKELDDSIEHPQLNDSKNLQRKKRLFKTIYWKKCVCSFVQYIVLNNLFFFVKFF